MHRNFRRKSGRHNPRRGAGWSNRGPKRGFAWEKRHEWRCARATMRALLHRNQWDLLPKRYPAVILWNWW
jgi:hypothetical protein